MRRHGPQPSRRGPIRRNDCQADQGPEPEDVQAQSRDEEDASGFRVHNQTPVELTRIDRIGEGMRSSQRLSGTVGWLTWPGFQGRLKIEEVVDIRA
jgi:hypothetical protein